jgi:hypothetical protein
MQMPRLDLDHIFSYHAPTPEKNIKYVELRMAALRLARVIDATVPDCADKSDAIRKLRECVMTANAAIALDGRLHVQTEASHG